MRQGSSETATELTICIEDLVLQYKWPDGQTECCCIDLCYHATKFYEVRQFIQTETTRKEVSLTWDILIEKAKHLDHTCQEYKEHQETNSDTGSMQSHSNPALNADAVRGASSKEPNFTRDSNYKASHHSVANVASSMVTKSIAQ